MDESCANQTTSEAAVEGYNAQRVRWRQSTLSFAQNGAQGQEAINGSLKTWTVDATPTTLRHGISR